MVEALNSKINDKSTRMDFGYFGVLEAEFDKMWKEAGVSGIRGHRSVGGYRASIYNAMPIESVKVLVDLMKEFERIKG